MSIPTHGQEINDLEILSYVPGQKKNGVRVSTATVECRCKRCDRVFIANWENVKAGRTKTCGCSRRQGYIVNESKFLEIESPDDAYWLGFLMADGCVTDRGQLKLALQKADRLHVERFGMFLGATHLVKDAKRTIGQDQSIITVNSVLIVTNLLKHGIHPRKTWTCRPWVGPDHLTTHFWRGCVDGDGSVLYYPRRPTAPHVGLCGNQHVVAAFSAFVRHRTGRAGSLRIWQTERQKGTSNYYGDTRWATLPQAQDVIRLLGYDNPEYTSLERKREAARAILATTVRECNHELSREELIERFKLHGTWGAVAKSYGISPGTMTYHVQRAEITANDVAAHSRKRSRWDEKPR